MMTVMICFLFGYTYTAHGFLHLGHQLNVDVKNLKLLMNSVHNDHWNIAYRYSDECTPEDRPDPKECEELITFALNTWLQPLRDINTKEPIVNKFHYQLHEDMHGDDQRRPELVDLDLRVTFYCRNKGGLRSGAQASHLAPDIYFDNGIHLDDQLLISIMIHEIGHAFGLGDTYIGRNEQEPSQSTGGLPDLVGTQPASIMGMHLWAHTPDYISQDDKNCIIWLYKVIHEGLPDTDCYFPDYEFEEEPPGCVPKHPLLFELKQGYVEYAKWILNADKNIDINAQDSSGNTALHYAVQIGNAQLMTLLLTHEDLIIHIRNKMGETPLELARELGSQAILNMLLNHPNTVDIPGPTVTILTPSAGQTYDHGTPTITGNFSGAAVPISLNLTLNGAVINAEVSDTGFTHTLADALDDGEYTLVAEVTDANGNTAEATVTFAVIVPTDDPTQIVVDWVDLETHDLSLLSSIKSRDSTTQTAIIFVNESEYEITYYWVGFAGDETRYGSVPAGTTYSQTTYAGHVWLIKDHRGRNLAIFEAKEENGRVTINNKSVPMLLTEDINKDGVVDILDLDLVSANFLQTGENIADVNNDGTVNIVDLTLVAAAFGQTSSGAPDISTAIPENLSAEKIEEWLREARSLNLPDAKFQRGILVLKQLLKMSAPKQTVLLPNYPNPFNPETWIPYQLANPADVSITIYTSDGKLVRKLDIGHQQIGLYQNRSKAAYWDGKNEIGEPVASNVYFYTLTAGNFSATRKMLILK